MDIATPLLAYGPLGISVIALALVNIRQYNDNKALQNKYDAIQEARRLDAKETTDKVTAPLESISQTVSLMYEKLKASKEA